MDSNNDTPFAVATMLWEDLKGQPRLSVLLKGTFAIPHGGVAAFAKEPLPIFASDVPWDDDSTQTVRFESDMVPFKPRADVVLVGKAHLPRQKRPETPLDVVLRVGSLRKTIRVFGDRRWWFPSQLALIPDMTTPEPFATMDLVYERAFGGIDAVAARYCAENLVGKGFIGKKSRDSVHQKPLPNLEDPEDLIRSWDSRPKPVGFGFYGRGWMPRLKFTGSPRPDPEARERARGLAPDFSYDFFNAAHPDLQVKGYLRGNEEVELQNLSRDPFVEFRPPGIRPKVSVAKWTTPPEQWLDRQGQGGRPATLADVPTVEEPLKMCLDTLVLIPDEKIFYLVFRGQCKVASLEDVEVARITVTAEMRDQRRMSRSSTR